MTDPNLLRTVRLTPYRKGYGPTFTLRTWDTNSTTRGGKYRLRYELRMHDRDLAPLRSLYPTLVESDIQHIASKRRAVTSVLFAGADFGCSPMHAIDSDETIRAILGFLTLRPGDTDREYFDTYTPEQLEYCANHAETLGCEALTRFGEG